MTYTVGEMAKLLDVPASTLRYYDKEGLLPFVARSSDARLELFRHQREVLCQQMDELQHTLDMIDYKCWFYETAKASGTVQVPKCMTEEEVPEAYRAIRQELQKTTQT